MAESTAVLIFLVLTALVFDFINGFHDAANAISTIVSTRVLTPGKAVVLAAVCNLCAGLLVGVPVAKTIGTGIIHTDIITDAVIFAALAGAIIWNLITWYFGLPSSSSHALIGGLIGAGLIKGGAKVLVLAGITKTAIFIVLSPTIGLLLGLGLMVLVMNLCRRSTLYRTDRVFRKLQLVSAAVYSLGHGMNDAQKTMGIIALILFSRGMLGPVFHIPVWTEFLCYGVLALGTLFGGWRIVKTMGTRITKLRPIGGFCAETAAAVAIIGASAAGIPVSTTHTITGAIVGVGAAERLTAVRWGVAGSIIWAWVLTIPLSAGLAAAVYELLLLLTA